MKARIVVRLRPGILDPQGTTIRRALEGLGFPEVRDMRVGKILDLTLDETDPGRARQRLLCATFEAILGALYLDRGLEAVRAFVEPLLAQGAQRVQAEQADVDAKSLLQEWAQAELGRTPYYRTAEISGPDHAKLFTVEVYIGSEVYGTGTGRNKQAAAQAAAVEALRRVGPL